ncbi:MAG: RidA family protein [Deltaproteobacteria bacterium]|nr:RidA family protein [Deltaproteobacteria bacterium]
MSGTRIIATDAAPRAIGPYSQAVAAGGLVFCSGQIALDPATGSLVGGTIADETRRVLENLRAVLAAAGLELATVVRTTVYLTNLSDFPVVNQVYAEFFPPPSPARSTVQVAALPRDARVEIDAIAVAAAER